MGKPLIITAAVGALLALSALPASASCRSGSFRFDFGQAMPVDTVLTMTRPSCNWTFRGGTYVTYESISVVRRAANLTIAPLSNGFGMNIRTRGGFRGRDAFSVQVCGQSRASRGCTTVNFAVNIL
jgi:hypothetical protein